ncbi:14321_t:CDS:2 [Gigaspora rosea]|nr:14321_t:CDS:2 [Gigaspora rosea]
MLINGPEPAQNGLTPNETQFPSNKNLILADKTRLKNKMSSPAELSAFSDNEQGESSTIQSKTD